ncbi:synapse differentiation-inducing gene protein 1-like [Xyrauchen texanus]|uniref:synapse differentiation-inducing gene protein 1-like n=1 Tax=Xyrauchen texanus TaxID=154827 RepID=UPI002241C07F|nr:synapse differentiation-inducing gene protein 1-like [Xyrauchen texanus]
MEGVRSDAPTYLAWSIFSTFCCCLPLGIAAIVYSCRVNTANVLRDSKRAHESSRIAKNLNIASVVIGIIFTILSIVLLIVF